jgi:two-component system, sensor histidine kinase and response regulator
MLKFKKTTSEAISEITPSETSPHQKRYLLVVDDEPSISLLLTSLFAPYYTVRSAESGQAALTMLKEGYTPQVIIADQRMPAMSGAQFLSESRKILPNTVRATLTGYTDIKEIVDSINNGAIYRFIAKPWEDLELLQAIRLCFEQYDLSIKNVELEAALERVQALNQEKNEILGIVSHDLKNPISSILGMTELLDPTSDMNILLEDYPQFVGLIRQTAENMLELVKGLLDDHWLDSGKMELYTTLMDVSTLVHFIVEDYRQRATKKGITLHSDTPQDMFALADERRLHQVIDNLVSNAVKYSPSNTHVFVRTLKLQVPSHQVLQVQNTIRIEIQDQGPGLTDEDKSKLFGKFTRLSAQPTSGEHSTGLGLSIVKKMVEAMNGRVWCESEFGHGATFIVELPTATV